MRCKAAIVPKMGDEIILEEVELAEPQEDEVRLKIMTCTICHSDTHALNGEHGEYEGPGIAGHEIAGIVDKVGSKVSYVKPGDRVLCTEVRQGCGHCEQCLHDRPWFCENNTMTKDLFRIPSPYTRLNGERIIQTCSGASGFAQYTNCHESMLCKLDDDIPFEIGSALACGFMSGFGAVLNRCRIRPGESFVAVGCGGVGLSAIMGARYSGAIPIIGIDTNDEKLEAAKRFGATHVFNPKTCDAVEEVRRVTRGFGCDHSLVAVAGPGIKRMTLDMTAGYGRCVIVGHEHPKNEMMDYLCSIELLSGLTVTGSVMGGVTLRRDIPKYMDMYRKGLVDIDALLTRRYRLDDIREALYDSLHGALKNVVICDDELAAEYGL